MQPCLSGLPGSYNVPVILLEVRVQSSELLPGDERNKIKRLVPTSAAARLLFVFGRDTLSAYLYYHYFGLSVSKYVCAGFFFFFLLDANSWKAFAEKNDLEHDERGAVCDTSILKASLIK